MTDGVIVAGAVEQIPGLLVRNWKGDPRLRLKMGEDGKPRPSWVRWLRGIGLHTTLGIPGGKDSRQQRILLGLGPRTDIGAATNAWWSKNGKPGGAHLVVDFDGSVACLADLLLEETYHASSVNDVTIGIEIAQRADACLFAGQLQAVVRLVDWLTERFQIQRQIPSDDYHYGQRTDRIARGGRDVVGVYGHRDQTLERGQGDPGDFVFHCLAASGYERFNFRVDEDLDAWRRRQAWLSDQVRPLGALALDGVPGPQTVGHIRHLQAIRGRRPTGLFDGPMREEFLARHQAGA